MYMFWQRVDIRGLVIILIITLIYVHPCVISFGSLHQVFLLFWDTVLLYLTI